MGQGVSIIVGRNTMTMQFAQARPGLRECPDCGLFQRLPEAPGSVAVRCPRCASVLRHHRTNPEGRALALAVTGLILLVVATQEPFLGLDIAGRNHQTLLFSGPVELRAQGLWELAIVVFATTIAVPLAKLLCLGWVMLGARLPRRQRPRHLRRVFRWVEWMTPWSMVEVFLLGFLVAYTKLTDLATVQVGIAVYALGGLMLVMAAAEAVLDHEAIWQALDRDRIAPAPPAAPAHGGLIGCDTCRLVCVGFPGEICPRCDSRLRERKPASNQRTWALLFAAALLYVPANVLPVMTVISFGRGAPDTILSGIVKLAAAGMWPLALLVFFASITVPVLKLLSLSGLLLGTRLHSKGRLRERTLLYRIVDAVGRWSMIDVFMVSILTAVVRLGAIASVTPGPGAVAFCSVVILTMLAAGTFDPRLMWDAAGRSTTRIAAR